MKIALIGAGLIGITTAFLLGCRGHEVIVIDRAEGPARETSFANGALLTPGMSEPWNSPGCWRVLLSSLGRSDASLQLRLRALPGLIGWGCVFLANSTANAFERNTLRNLRLGLYSLEVMQQLREQTGIEYGRAARGILKIFRGSAALDRVSATANRLRPEGLNVRPLSREETVEIEPALVSVGHQLAGALHYATDESGDAYRYCVAMTDHARKLGVTFRFDTVVASLELRSGKIASIVTERGSVTADRYIVTAGSHSTPLLRRVGVQLPVQPAKGYSLTFDRPPGTTPLLIPIVDDLLHAVVVPMGDTIRVAGTAEFAGFDQSLNPDRIRNLPALCQEVLPQMRLDPGAARPWCGLRPMSADGVPIIGPTRISNLYVSTGHGHLGWTMAAGSAQLLADLMSGVTPSLDPSAYDPNRFSPRQRIRGRSA